MTNGHSSTPSSGHGSLDPQLGVMPTSNALAALRDVAFGSIAGVCGKIVEYPADTCKVLLQSQPLPTDGRPLMYKGPIDCFRQTIQNDGFFALYRGLASPLVGAVLENATLFVAYNRIQDAIRVVSPPPALSTNDSSLAKAPLSLPQMFVAGALAGTVASFLLTPVELVKCKIQVQNMVAAAEATASKGSSSPRLHQSRTGAAAAATAHQARSYTTPTAPKTSVAHALDPGHLSNTTRTVPATAAAAAAAGPMDVVSRTWRRHGLRGFYVGHMATMVRETGGSAAWFGVYEVAVRELVALRERERAASSASGTPMTKADLATTELLFAGALAGVSYNVVLFPADTVKSFQQTEEELRSLRGGSANTSSGQAAPRSGFWKVGFDLYRAQGLRGLYRGALLVTIKSVPTSAVIFGVYEGLNRHF